MAEDVCLEEKLRVAKLTAAVLGPHAHQLLAPEGWASSGGTTETSFIFEDDGELADVTELRDGRIIQCLICGQRLRYNGRGGRVGEMWTTIDWGSRVPVERP